MKEFQDRLEPESDGTHTRDEHQLDDLEILKNAFSDPADSGSKGQEAFNSILMKYRERLLKIVLLRMGARLQGRVDASDVIQDTYAEASRTLDRYLEKPDIPVFLWLRLLAGEKLIQVNRFHFETQKRSVKREIHSNREMPQASSVSMASQLVGAATSPSEAAIRNENKRLLESALDKMNRLDREVLVLRHFEHLSCREAAIVLKLGYEAVKKRYIRALVKLERILTSLDDTSKIDMADIPIANDPEIPDSPPDRRLL